MQTVNLEVLQARLKGLREGHSQLRADLLATEGAIMECEHWIAYVQDAVTLGELQGAVVQGASLDVPVEPNH